MRARCRQRCWQQLDHTGSPSPTLSLLSCPQGESRAAGPGSLGTFALGHTDVPSQESRGGFRKEKLVLWQSAVSMCPGLSGFCYSCDLAPRKWIPAGPEPAQLRACRGLFSCTHPTAKCLRGPARADVSNAVLPPRLPNQTRPVFMFIPGSWCPRHGTVPAVTARNFPY